MFLYPDYCEGITIDIIVYIDIGAKIMDLVNKEDNDTSVLNCIIAKDIPNVE